MATSLKHTIRGKLLILSLYIPCLTVFATNGTFEYGQNSTAIQSEVLDGTTQYSYTSTEVTHLNLEPTRTLSYDRLESSVDALGQNSTTTLTSLDSSTAQSTFTELDGSVSFQSVQNYPNFNLKPSLYQPESLASYTGARENSAHSGFSEPRQGISSSLVHRSDAPIFHPILTNTVESLLKPEILITEIPSMESSPVYPGATLSVDDAWYSTDSRTSQFSMASSSATLFVPAGILITPSVSAENSTPLPEVMYNESQYIHPSTSDAHVPFITDSTLHHTDYSSATLSKQSLFSIPSESQHISYSEVVLDSASFYEYTSGSPYQYTSDAQYTQPSTSLHITSTSLYLYNNASEIYIPLVSGSDTLSGVSDESYRATTVAIEPSTFPQLSSEFSDTTMETTVPLETTITLLTTGQIDMMFSPSLSYEPITVTQPMFYNQTAEDTSNTFGSASYIESNISSSSSYAPQEFQSVTINQSLSFPTIYSSSTATLNASYDESSRSPSGLHEWTTTDTPIYTANPTSEPYITEHTAISEAPSYPYLQESSEGWPLPEQTSHDSQEWRDYQTETLEVAPTRALSESEQTVLSTSSSLELVPTLSSILETLPSATVEITTPILFTTPATYINKKFIITFNGDCQPLVSDTERTAEFQEKVQIVLAEYLEISSDDVLMDRLACGSVKSYFVIYNATQNFSTQISELVSSGDLLIDMDFPETNGSALFRAYKMEEVDIINPAIVDSGGQADDRKLSDKDITLIILACCISVILVIIVIVVCARRMYSKKYAQSFNLMDTPHAHLKMEDFTLTQFPRQRRSYDGEGVQVQSYSHYQSNGQPLLTSGHPTHTHNHSADLDSTLERSVDVGEFRLQDNKTSSFVPTRSFDFSPNGGHSKSDRMFPSTSMDSSSSIHERSTENLVPGLNGSNVHGSVNPIYSGDETEATASVSSDPPPYSDGVPNNL